MLVVGNGRLITRDEGFPFVENGAVAIDKTRIIRVGTTSEIRETYRDAEYIDAGGGVIMPAFRGVFLANLFRFKRLAVRNKEICHAAGVFRVRWATT